MKLRSRAARRYAKALHDQALEAGDLDTVAADMHALAGLFKASPELAAFAGNYLVPSQGRARALESLFAARLHPLSWRFMRFVESKRRMGLMADIAADFLDLEEVRKGIVRGVLASALPLSGADTAEVASRLGRLWSRQLVLRSEEDPGLLGGCRLQVGDTVYDSSLAARLRLLRQTMLAG